MTDIEDIKTEAVRLGACGKIRGAEDMAALVELFYSPQGKEFCQEKNFPTMKMLRSLGEGCELADYGIFVDYGHLDTWNIGDITLAGKTHGDLEYEGVERKYTVILLHGAKATITARNHAVIEVINVSGREVKYDIDETVVLL